jgi:hypothetical protein
MNYIYMNTKFYTYIIYSIKLFYIEIVITKIEKKRKKERRKRR